MVVATNQNTTQNSQEGFVPGLSNISDILTGAIDVVENTGSDLLKLYSNWSDIQLKKNEAETQQEYQTINQNLAIQQANMQAQAQQTNTQLITLSVVGVLGITAAFFLYKFLK